MEAVYWLLANVFVPVLFAPLLIFIPLITGTPWAVIKGRLHASIGDGQLLWAAIGIGATGAYDAGIAAFVLKQGSPLACHVMFIVLVALVVLSSYVVNNASQAAYSYEEQVDLARASGQPIPRKEMGRIVSFSIGMTVLVTAMTVLLKFVIAV